MNSKLQSHFSSRWALIMSALGVAVGTGNIWRFPRIAAQNGGEEGAGALIIAWIVLLFLWSIPLIISEYVIGKKHRKGVVGNIALTIGKKNGWRGGLVALVATAIAFFYAVIVGWSLFYFVQFLTHPLPVNNQDSQILWDNFQTGFTPGFYHIIALIIGALAISKGVSSIERVNKILIPSLLVIIIIAFIRTLMLPGSFDGIKYLFTPQWSQLLDPRIWLEALTQNAWDTGAGWGLFLTYAAYMKKEHGVVKNAFITGIGNNIISLVMAMVIFGTVFSVLHFTRDYTTEQVVKVMQTSGPASTGLTFIWIPQLFALLPFGRILAILFFAGLSFAGFSSLISMLEMSSKVFIDAGVKRSRAILIVMIIVYIFGIPSAINVNYLSNQDFVWGLGLIVSGVIIALSIQKMDYYEIKEDLGSVADDWNINKLWLLSTRYFIPIAGTILILWWLVQAITVFAPNDWYNPFNPYSVATVILQWTLGVIIVVLANKYLTRKLC